MQSPSGRASPWDASDEQNPTAIDHSLWQETLDGYLRPSLSEVNRFDYGGLKSSEDDRARLQGYLAQLQDTDPRLYPRAEQKAYWINLYNALTVRIVVDAYPVDSIRDIRGNWFVGLISRGPWRDAEMHVAGEDLSLDEIEHGILRPIWRDARIHYGLNCASLGCPNLLPTAFTATNTEELLELGAREFVNSTHGVKVASDDRIVVSSIYAWFRDDFGNSEEDVMAHLKRYADGPLADRLRDFDGTIDYAYDWRLNQP